MKVALDIYQQRAATCEACPNRLRFSADRTMVLCQKRGGSAKRECPRCWAWLEHEPHVQGCPAKKWPDSPARNAGPQSTPPVAKFKIITKPGHPPTFEGEPPDWLTLPTTKVKLPVFPVAHGSPEWTVNMKACRRCRHYRNGAPEICNVDQKQCSTHALRGDCPKKLQPHHKNGPIEPAAWPKLPSMPPALAETTLPFPIDIVYTWVDGSDPAFVEQFRQHFPKGSPRGSRFVDCDELKYSLRSVAQFAPWVRYVHLVTNGQVPKWLNLDHPKIRLVTHRQIFTNPEFLPTFNSIAIEQNLHRLPDLSEQFLYSNDDTFFGRPVTPDQFFTPDGKAKIGFSGGINSNPNSTGYGRFCFNARQALVQLFGDRPWRHAVHQIQPLVKTALAEIETRLPEMAHANSSHKLRSASSVALSNVLWPAYMEAAGHAVATKIGNRYIHSGSEASMRETIRKPAALVCVNNSVPEHQAGLRRFFQAYFPDNSAYEGRTSELETIDPARVRVVCLNLDRYTERWKRFSKAYQSSTVLSRFQLERVSAIPWQELPSPEGFHPGGPHFYAITVRHVEVISDALARGLDYLIVFEDDATIEPGFDDELAHLLRSVPPGWHGLWLGCHVNLAKRVGPVRHDRYVRLTGQLGSHAYILSRQGIETVAPQVTKMREQLVIDAVLAGMQRDSKKWYGPRRWISLQTSHMHGRDY